MEKFKERQQVAIKADEDIDIDKKVVELKLWHYIVFPVWIWKTFIFAKKEAFRFKYDAAKLNEVEDKLMRQIGIVLYLTTLIYFAMMFGFPFSYIKGRECGEGFDSFVFILYGVYAIVTAIIEVWAGIRIQRLIDDKKVLSFNRWHCVELFMGQIARFDTFLDTCFLVLLI